MQYDQNEGIYGTEDFGNDYPSNMPSSTSVVAQTNENIIQWQLELDSILERVEHMLRGDKIVYQKDRNGNVSVYWKAPTDKTEIIMNEKGINEIMRILSLYLNRNTILSNYSETIINYKVYDLGCELNDLIYCRYQDFGLDTHEKRKMYPILIRQIIDTVHSAYLRALNGGERESLRETRQVVQNENMNNAMGFNPNNYNKERGVLNPMRYILGRNY